MTRERTTGTGDLQPSSRPSVLLINTQKMMGRLRLSGSCHTNACTQPSSVSVHMESTVGQGSKGRVCESGGDGGEIDIRPEQEEGHD
jgi:hypothetical protein